jgi:dihydroorotase
MKLLFKQATILDIRSEYHLTQQDILISHGSIVNIEKSLTVPEATQIIAEELFICPGFIDVFSHFNDPGFEQKETLQTGALAAQKGGYTSVMTVPNTNPIVDNKAGVEYLIQQSKNLPIHILPIGAVSSGTDGNSLTEMIEMHHCGAVAFSDGLQAVDNASLLVKALQYIKNFDGVLIQIPADKDFGTTGLVNESALSTQLGLPGIPAIAEETRVARDIELCAYTHSNLHITGISTAKSVELIKKAKERNIPVTCSVTPYHLLLTEREINGYNTHAKVYPPLRSNTDVLALQKALKEGIIDCIAAHHFPQETDAKQCEFATAKFGMSTLEHCFKAIASVPGISPIHLYHVFSNNVRQIFKLPYIPIAVGNSCDATAFTLKGEQPVNTKDFISKNANSAFIGKTLTGSIKATINQSHYYLAN